MPFVNEIEETQADPHLLEIYGKIERDLGFLPHYFKTLGAKPAVIEAQLQLSPAVMADSALPMVTKEQIGLVVSGINSSTYCIMFHMELLRRFGVEKNLARKLTTDYESAAVEPKVKELFKFAEKLTRHPDDITESDTDAGGASPSNIANGIHGECLALQSATIQRSVARDRVSKIAQSC